MSDSTFRWCIGSEEGNALPKWARSAAMDQYGEVFLPIESAVSPNAATRAALCAIWDGVPITYCDDHPFAPASWIAWQYPKVADSVAVARDKVRKHFGFTGEEVTQ